MTVGLDTNILLRYVQEDDEGQSPLAAALIDKRCSVDEPGLVSCVASLETWWSMRRGMRVPAVEAADVFEALLDNAHLRFAHEGLMREAVDAQRAGAADFADYLIGALNRAAGATTTYTFDKFAARHADFTLLSKAEEGA